MDKEKWEKQFRELREKTLSREEQLHKIHRHKSVLKKRKSN